MVLVLSIIQAFANVNLDLPALAVKIVSNITRNVEKDQIYIYK